MATCSVAESVQPGVDGCEQFLVSQHPGWLRAAFLFTGDRVSAQDLAQETAVRVVVQWRRVRRADNPPAYARRLMLNAFLSGRRRAWRNEFPHDEPPDGPVPSSAYDAVDQQEELRRALMALPPRQRAAVVLRHWEDRTEAETARLMGCSTGNVKALTSRGLAQLREHLSTAGEDERSNEGTATR